MGHFERNLEAIAVGSAVKVGCNLVVVDGSLAVSAAGRLAVNAERRSVAVFSYPGASGSSTVNSGTARRRGASGGELAAHVALALGSHLG